MGYVLVIGVVLLVWTAISVLYLAKEVLGLLSLSGGRKETWLTYVIVAPAVVILLAVRAIKGKRK